MLEMLDKRIWGGKKWWVGTIILVKGAVVVPT